MKIKKIFDIIRSDRFLQFHVLHFTGNTEREREREKSAYYIALYNKEA